MSLFSSLIPGVREIRAPLIAGYLWLICAWLLLEPYAPSPDDNRVYGRFAEIAEAVGPVGRALAVSVVAYLIGSLVQTGVRNGWARVTRDLDPAPSDEQEGLFREIEREGRPRGVGTVLEIANPFSDPKLQYPYLRGAPLLRAVREIAERELVESFRQLQISVRSIERTAGDKAVCFYEMNASTPVVLLFIGRDGIQGQTGFVVPNFLPVRDLLGHMHLLETRLLEAAESTGAQIERLRAEADFRFTLVSPLVALILILSFGVDLPWIFALLVPIALAVQGVHLEQRRAEEVLDALRARTHTAELERITPVFERYRACTTQLLRGLEDAQWPSARRH
jgi:hypothetical protein